MCVLLLEINASVHIQPVCFFTFSLSHRFSDLCSYLSEDVNPKFQQITRPRVSTRKKLGIRLLFRYEYRAESGVIT